MGQRIPRLLQHASQCLRQEVLAEVFCGKLLGGIDQLVELVGGDSNGLDRLKSRTSGLHWLTGSLWLSFAGGWSYHQHWRRRLLEAEQTFKCSDDSHVCGRGAPASQRPNKVFAGIKSLADR